LLQFPWQYNPIKLLSLLADVILSVVSSARFREGIVAAGAGSIVPSCSRSGKEPVELSPSPELRGGNEKSVFSLTTQAGIVWEKKIWHADVI
jgi:hypothetical protein